MRYLPKHQLCARAQSIWGEKVYANSWARDERLEHQGIPGQKIRLCHKESLKREKEERNLLHVAQAGNGL